MSPIMQTEKENPISGLPIRPHHALCAQFFKGKGYSEQFVEHMYAILSELERGTAVTVTDGCDAICAGCPNNRNGVCETDEKVCAIDARAIAEMGLSFGDTLPWRELSALAGDRIIRSGKLKDVCRDCEWFGICGGKQA